MTPSHPALRSAAMVALAGLGALLALPASQAQGLRTSPQLGASRPASPAASAPRAADYIVAIVNSEPVTNNELRARLVRAEQQLTRDKAALPPRQALAREVLELLISEKAQLQLARESGLKVDNAAVDQAEQTVARQNQVSVEELRRRIARDGLSVAQFREDLRNQLLLMRLREREIEPRVRVTEQDLDQFIQQQAGAAPAPLEINLAQVLVAVPENASAAQVASLQARAEDVARRARAGEDFAALARASSDAPGRDRNGGAMGLLAADRYPTLFVESTQALGVGGIAGPVRSGAGFHILKVLEKRKGSVLPGVSVTQTHARHILLRTSPQLSESAARERLADYKRRIAAGRADFATLAREHSQDGSANQGGDLGWANPGQFVPEFEDALKALAPGQVSDPVVSRFGVHLIQLIERRQATLGEREQREIARNQLREQKLEEAFERWAQDVRGRAYVEYREAPTL